MPGLFNARSLLESSLQVTDESQYDRQELLALCKLFRLPMPVTRTEVELFLMPGGYPLPSQDNISGLSFTGGTTAPAGRLSGMFLRNKTERVRCSINSLDDDVLKRIFVLAYDNKLLLRGPLTLIYVTKRWGTIVLAMPRLWGILHIDSKDLLYNPFYSIIYHVFHAHELHVWVNSSAILASMTTLAAVIPPKIRSTLHVPHLRNLVLTGSGAIETMDAFPFDYPNLTHLGLTDLRRLFPLNLLANCPALKILVMDCSVEVWSKRFVDEEMLLCDEIACTSLHVEWKATWVSFDVFTNNLPILGLNNFRFILSDNQRFRSLPLALMSKNPNIQTLMLRGVSLAYTDIEEIRPLMGLSLLKKLELSDVDDATSFFQSCADFPSAHFPRLVSLHLTNVRLNGDSLINYICMKTRTPLVDVSPLQTIHLEGMALEENHLTELNLIRSLGQIEVKISL